MYSTCMYGIHSLVRTIKKNYLYILVLQKFLSALRAPVEFKNNFYWTEANEMKEMKLLRKKTDVELQSLLCFEIIHFLEL